MYWLKSVKPEGRVSGIAGPRKLSIASMSKLLAVPLLSSSILFLGSKVPHTQAHNPFPITPAPSLGLTLIGLVEITCPGLIQWKPESRLF